MKMKIIKALILFCGICFSFEIYLSPRYTQWEEFDTDGRKLLEEKGWILALGIRKEGKLFRGGAELYGGTLKYDGQTQAGTPVQTDSVYSGFSLYGGVGWYFGNSVLFSPKVLYTLEGWVRDIKSTATALGYREIWSYHTLDFEGEVVHKMKIMEMSMFATLRLMLGDAVMKADLEGVPTLYPKRGPAYKLGCRFRKNRYGVEIAHSYVKFNRSDPQPTFIPGVYVLQPESVRRTMSLTFFLRF